MNNSVNIELGLNKKVRRAYGIDEIALVPGNRTLASSLIAKSWNNATELHSVDTLAAAKIVSRKWASNLLKS